MRKNTVKPRRNSIIRAVFVGFSLVLQLGWLLLMILELNAYSTYISLFTSLLTSLVVLRLYSKHTNSAYKIPWIMLMMALPVMGLSLYLLTEVAITPKSVRGRIASLRSRAQAYLPQEEQILEELAIQDRSAANQCGYLWMQSYDEPPYIPSLSSPQQAHHQSKA